MNNKIHGKFITSLVAAMLGLLAATGSGWGQTSAPFNWVNDPFCTNQNFTVTRAGSANPSFVNNGEQCGTLYANSPLGATLKLEQPGDMISCTGQVVIAGDINPDGDMQFRLGLFHQGSNSKDKNWLGYAFGNPAGSGVGAKNGLYVRKYPNTSVYTSGSADNATRPDCGEVAYSPGWSSGAYDFSLAVTKLSDQAHGITWKLTGIAPNTYSYSGAYTNTVADTLPPAFDQVGILGGAALFNSASTADSISFTNLTVILSKPHVAQ